MPVLPTTLSTLLLAGGLLLTGCSASTDSAGDSAMPASAGDSAAGGSSGEALTDGGTTAATAPGRVVDLRAAPGAAVIRTAELVVRVDDVRAAADQAARVVTAAGGALEAERTGGTDAQGSAALTLRVPPAAFDRTVADLARLGDERSRQVGTEDVTDQVVDLEARLATQRASVARVRALLDEAGALGEVVTIEGELTKRTADLESLEARLEALTAQVDLSTIVLRLDGDRSPSAGDALGFGDGLRGGWAALATTGRLLAVTLGALLPFAPLALVLGLVAWRARARRAGTVGA